MSLLLLEQGGGGLQLGQTSSAIQLGQSGGLLQQAAASSGAMRLGSLGFAPSSVQLGQTQLGGAGGIVLGNKQQGSSAPLLGQAGGVLQLGESKYTI